MLPYYDQSIVFIEIKIPHKISFLSKNRILIPNQCTKNSNYQHFYSHFHFLPVRNSSKIARLPFFSSEKNFKNHDKSAKSVKERKKRFEGWCALPIKPGKNGQHKTVNAM